MSNCFTVEEWTAGSKYLIMVPYAQVLNMETGANVGTRSGNKQKEMYLKNCCVALISAKTCNPAADVALVTNIEVPEPYTSILERAGVAVIHVPFDKFNFGVKYTWGLAFYKLCAQYYISHSTGYEAVLCLDSDTYTQADYQPLWDAVKTSAVFYRMGTGTSKTGVSRIYEEAGIFRGTDEEFTHYGGEFFAASSADMRVITEKEEVVFEKMMETGYRVTTGDEFISSVVANEMHDGIRLANEYVFRFWTGAYRCISPSYKTTLICLHVPAEKETGMIRLFNRYISKGRTPSREKVWKMLHIPRRSVIETAKAVVKKVIGRQ